MRAVAMLRIFVPDWHDVVIIPRLNVSHGRLRILEILLGFQLCGPTFVYRHLANVAPRAHIEQRISGMVGGNIGFSISDMCAPGSLAKFNTLAHGEGGDVCGL
jgi:hypothetical protein